MFNGVHPMSTESLTPSVVPVPVGTPLSMKEVAELLVKQYDLHEGLYDLLLEYQFAFGNFGPTPTQITPGAMIGLAKLGLTRVEKLGPLTVDAAQINPATKVRARTVRRATGSDA